MLDDCLPRNGDGAVIDDAFALFIDRQGHVISASRPDIEVGEKFGIDPALLNLPAGEGSSSIFSFKGSYYAMGVHASSGYREFKGPNDPYKNDVRAVVFIPLSEAVEMVERVDSSDALAASVKTSNRLAGAKQVEIATFFIGDHWIGVNAQWVLEAVSMDFISRVPHAPAGLKGVMKLRDSVLPVLSVHDRVGKGIKYDNEETQIVVITTTLGPWGMIVDRLGPIPTVDPNQIDTDSAVVRRAGGYVSGLVKPAHGSDWPRLLIVVDPQELRKTLLSIEGEEFMASLDAN
jgi:chemotaxis signal transduction protein